MPVQRRNNVPNVAMDAIYRREEARKELLAFEEEHAELLTEYMQLFDAQRRAEEEVKTAMASAAQNADAKVMEFLPAYKTVRPVSRIVDVQTLFQRKPKLYEVHPEVFEVKAKNLDALVDSGELEAGVRNEVVREEFGTPRCYIPAYK